MPSRPIAITVSFILYRLSHPMNASSSVRSSRGSGSGRTAPVFSGVFAAEKEDWIDVNRRGALGDCTDCVVVGLRLTVYDVDGIALDVDDTVLDVDDGRVFEVGVGVTRDAMRLLDCV